VHSGKTILVVDDEASVRSIARKILEKAGHCVLEAPDALRALNLLDTYHGRLDLVICDVVMPQMTGTEFVERLKVEQPGMKVILISGKVPESPVRDVELLRKPFSAAALRDAVSRIVLAGGPGR